jgi:small-conductance mechanosensitive channel
MPFPFLYLRTKDEPIILKTTFFHFMNRINSIVPMPENVQPFLQYELFGSTYQQYLDAIVLFLIIFIGIRIFRRFILVRLTALAEKTSTDFDNRIVEGIQGISHFFTLYLAFYLMIKTLNIDNTAEKILDGIFLVLLVYEIIKLAQKFIAYILEKTTKESNETVTHGLRLMITIVMWSVGILLILSNLGFDITTLAASLGIGGIAVALAVQNILGDLFSSFSIYFDKPFQIGDFIVIGNDMGVVKKIGLKTTRIQTLQGEELVVSNKELTSARIQNFKKMHNRRVTFTIGVEYGTSSDKLKKIPEIIKDIIEKQENADFDRSHFAQFADFSLNVETVYYVNTNDYNTYMDTQQAINLAIKDAFIKEKIEMAFPTQTVFVRKEG